MNIDTEEKMKLRAEELKIQEEQERLEREEARRNRNFVQFYRNHITEFRYLMELNPVSAKLFLFIMEYMDNLNALVCSYSIFEDSLGISKPTVTRAIKILKDNGFLSVLKVGTSNVYILNQKVVWSSWENQKKYCQFEGKVLVAHSENRNFDNDLQVQRFKALRNSEYVKHQREIARKYGLRGANNND